MLNLLLQYIKPISYATGAVVVGIVLYGIHSSIKENGRYEGVIAAQQQMIREQSLQIEALSNAISLTNKLINERDEEVKALHEQMQGLTQNLGQDANSEAPDALKEYFNRLNAK